MLELFLQTGLNIVLFSDIIELDYNDIVDQCNSKNLPFSNDIELTSDSIYTICFTSSSTGLPKGALLSNGNIISNARTMELFDANFQV